MYECAKEAADKGYLINEIDEHRPFNWNTNASLRDLFGHAVTEEVWALYALEMEQQMKNEVQHYALKLDLIDHNWSINGCQWSHNKRRLLFC